MLYKIIKKLKKPLKNMFSNKMNDLFEDVKGEVEDAFETFDTFVKQRNPSVDQELVNDTVIEMTNKTTLNESDSKLFLLVFGKDKTLDFLEALPERKVFELKDFSELDRMQLEARNGDVAKVKGNKFVLEDGNWVHSN